MSIQFQAIKSLLINLLVTLIVLSFITTASYIQQQNAIGQIEATVVFNESATSIDEIGKGSDASFALMSLPGLLNLNKKNKKEKSLNMNKHLWRQKSLMLSILLL